MFPTLSLVLFFLQLHCFHHPDFFALLSPFWSKHSLHQKKANRNKPNTCTRTERDDHNSLHSHLPCFLVSLACHLTPCKKKNCHIQFTTTVGCPWIVVRLTFFNDKVCMLSEPAFFAPEFLAHEFCLLLCAFMKSWIYVGLRYLQLLNCTCVDCFSPSWPEQPS